MEFPSSNQDTERHLPRISLITQSLAEARRYLNSELRNRNLLVDKEYMDAIWGDYNPDPEYYDQLDE